MNGVLGEKFLNSICNIDEPVSNFRAPMTNDLSHANLFNNFQQMYNYLSELLLVYSTDFASHYSLHGSYFLSIGYTPHITRNEIMDNKSIMRAIDIDSHESYHILVASKNIERRKSIPSALREKICKLENETMEFIEKLSKEGLSYKEFNQQIFLYEKMHTEGNPDVKEFDEYIEKIGTVFWFPFYNYNEHIITKKDYFEIRDVVQLIPSDVKECMKIYTVYIDPDSKAFSQTSGFYDFFEEFIVAGYSIFTTSESIQMVYDLYLINEEKKIFDFNASVEDLIVKDCDIVEYSFFVWIEYFYFLSIYLGYLSNTDYKSFNTITGDQAIISCISSLINILENQKVKFEKFKLENHIITRQVYSNKLFIKELQKKSFLKYLNINLDKLIRICS